MKIVVVQGSPHRNGSSNILAEQFRAGAESAGHRVSVFDAGHARIAPCVACEICHTKSLETCCQQDDMELLRQMILSSDMVTLATPLYFVKPPRAYARGFLPWYSGGLSCFLYGKGQH